MKTNFKSSVGLAKAPAKQKPVSNDDRKRATGAIKKQPKRNAKYEIADIVRALQMAEDVDNPDRSKLYDIYKYILRDLRTKGQLRTARIKVKSEPGLMYRNGQPDEAASALFRKLWFTELIEAIVDAEFFGFRLAEVHIEDASQALVSKIKIIPNDYVSIEKQWILIEGTINGPYLPYGDIANELDLLEFGKPDDLGILLEISYEVIWKYYSRNDWSRAGEKFGMPILAIEADTNDDAELDDMEARAANFGTDGYIIMQKGDNAKIIERTGQRMHDIYLDSIKLSDENIGIGVNGQNASTSEKSFVGSAEVQERTQDDYTNDRLQNIADTMAQKVMPYLLAKGFPVEGLTFDYPVLVRARERRITGQPLPTDPKPADPATDPKADPKKEGKPAPAKQKPAPKKPVK